MDDGSSREEVDVQRAQNRLNSCNQQISALNMQLSEIDSALSEISTERDVYRIIGSIMISSDYSSVKGDLEEQRELVLRRIKTLESERQKAQDELGRDHGDATSGDDSNI